MGLVSTWTCVTSFVNPQSSKFCIVNLMVWNDNMNPKLKIFGMMQILAEKGELPTRFGSATLGILLLQVIQLVLYFFYVDANH
jgi:hypothetical protein